MKNRLIGFISIILGLYLIVTSGRSIVELWQRSKRAGEAEKSLAELKKQNNMLKNKLKTVQDNDFIEKVAREDLNLVKPGESVIILPEDLQKEKPTIPPPKPLANWQKWYKLLF